MSKTRVEYPTVNWAGRDLVPVQYLSTGLITLVPVRTARREYRDGLIGILGVEDWHRMQAAKGKGLNVDENYLR